MGGRYLYVFTTHWVYLLSITIYNNCTLKNGLKCHVNRPLVAFSWLPQANSRYNIYMANTKYAISQAIFGAGWGKKSVPVGSIDDWGYLECQTPPHFVTVACYWPWAAPPLPQVNIYKFNVTHVRTWIKTQWADFWYILSIGSSHSTLGLKIITIFRIKTAVMGSSLPP